MENLSFEKHHCSATAGSATGAATKPDINSVTSAVEKLREELRRYENLRAAGGGNSATRAARRADEAVYSTGCAAWDEMLPAQGICKGSLIEWLSADAACGAGLLALAAARQALASRWLVVVDRARRFYPPAAANLGIDLQRTIVVRPASAKEELWAIDQALRCRGVGVVWSPLASLAWRSFRRLQLAAEQGETLGLLLRPDRVRGLPSWAHLSLHVQPLVSGGDRRWQVELLHWRGKWTEQKSSSSHLTSKQDDQESIACAQTNRTIRLVLDEVTGALCEYTTISREEFQSQTNTMQVSKHETSQQSKQKAFRKNQKASPSFPLPVASPLAASATPRRTTGA
jgi:hypothetical protein